MDQSSFRVSIEGDVTVAKMRHASRLHSDADRLVELEDWLGRAASGSFNSRAFVLTGFGSTADHEHADSHEHYQSPSAVDPRVAELAWLIDSLPGPLVSAVDGDASGYACLAALMSDAALASDEAAFLHPYRSTGAIAGLALTRSLALRLGRQRAVEFIALGKPLPAKQAADWGLVEAALSSSEIHARSVRRALELAERPSELAQIRRTTGAALFRDFGAS